MSDSKSVDRKSLESNDSFVIVNANPKHKTSHNGNMEEVKKKVSEAMDLNVDIPAESESPSGPDSSSPGQGSPVDDGSTVFTSLTYLGAATINAPRSSVEIERNMEILNQQSQMDIPVFLTVPKDSTGSVVVVDPITGAEISKYPIQRIIFCARGQANSNDQSCFAFTCSHGDSADSTIFQCHVFRGEGGASVVSKVLHCFASAFQTIPRSSQAEKDYVAGLRNTFCFDVAIDIREDDGKGGWTTCPKDSSTFKLRKDVDKQVQVVVTQTAGPREISIERCFGVLISPGRNVSHNDMHLLEMISMGTSNDSKSYSITAEWNTADKDLQLLNKETPKENRLFFTIALDLVIKGIQDPVRFAIEGKTKIYPCNERFWYFSKRPYTLQYILTLKELLMPVMTATTVESASSTGSSGERLYEVVNCRSSIDIEREKAALNLSRPMPTQAMSDSPNDGDAEESDTDEPLMSGTGSVSKEVTDEVLLENWHEVLTKWHGNLKQRPKQVQSLVRKGVPEALRGEVWQLLAGCYDNTVLLEDYRVLITKETVAEQVIQRDINRTFPAHEFFREAGGAGQESLYRISKAYSVYDEEIGYCQGLSFLAAALLLHMPEEQAFCVLVKVMSEYHLRDVFKHGFETLHMKFFQLESLMQDQLSEVYDHFVELGLEAHMYASQWFLTLFTAKFPLPMVFHILDMYLCEGSDVIFRVALALLKISRKDLLTLDFEGILKYFRVQLPKRFRSEEATKEFMHVVASTKVSSKKLLKYEKEYLTFRQAQLQQEDPLETLERENKRLIESNLRLEQENDDLARELVTSKIALRGDLDVAEDKVEVLTKDLVQIRGSYQESEEEKKRYFEEAAQLKSLFRKEQERADTESSRNQGIITEYKQICKQLSERLEKQQTAHKEELQRIKAVLEACSTCSEKLGSEASLKKLDSSTIHHPLEDADPADSAKDRQIRDLELELAQTKLALVEAECKVQDLTHDLSSVLSELHESKSSWFTKFKTLTSSQKEGGASKVKTDKTDNNKESGGGLSSLVKSLSRDNVKRSDSTN